MGSGDKGLSRAWIMQEAEASLKRLQTDVIDLYQAHRDDPDTPQEETAQAFAELVKQGKVRASARRTSPPPRLKSAIEVSKAHGLPRYESLQPLYNLVERAGFEAELESLCQARRPRRDQLLRVGGRLPHRQVPIRGGPRQEPARRRREEISQRARPGVLKALDDVAARHKATPAQVALAWLIARPSVTAPIASATSLEQLQDILKATELQLDRQDIAQLNAASG